MPSMTTVLFPFTGAGVGGSHISTFNLARSLACDHGIATVVLAVEGSGIAKEAAAFGLDVHTVGGPPARVRSLIEDAMRVRERRGILNRYGAGAILHCSDLWTLQSWGVAAKTLRLPIVYHHRILAPMHAANRLLLKLADQVICISDACRANVAFLPKDRVASILNPFPDTVAVPRHAGRGELERLWEKEKPIQLIGFAANFQARKRPEFFLEVCSALSKRLPAARFVMFGRSRDVTIEQMQTCAETLGIGAKIFFAGFRSPPELNLAPLDVLAAPALAEPFGRTLVECLLTGTPYVATDDAGHSEICARWGGGKLVPVTATPEEFAATVAETIARPEILSSERLRDIALELAPRTHARKVRDIYERLPRIGPSIRQPMQSTA
jgi:glycosyltransferase involved in cell wall biosynthesis